jgi:hypothetical protein
MQIFQPVLPEDKLLKENSKLPAETNRLLKQGIWAYFLLLIFEGALRKWFLPGLATPLLIVRDPIALWLVINVWQRGMFPSSLYLKATVFIGILGIFTATLLGHGSLPVALFGARILLFHFPFNVCNWRIFTRGGRNKGGEGYLMASCSNDLY